MWSIFTKPIGTRGGEEWGGGLVLVLPLSPPAWPIPPLRQSSGEDHGENSKRHALGISRGSIEATKEASQARSEIGVRNRTSEQGSQESSEEAIESTGASAGAYRRSPHTGREAGGTACPELGACN